MPEYVVKYEIDVDADSPLEAAQKAYHFYMMLVKSLRPILSMMMVMK